MKLVTPVCFKFNPDQPRDDHGRWGETADEVHSRLLSTFPKMTYNESHSLQRYASGEYVAVNTFLRYQEGRPPSVDPDDDFPARQVAAIKEHVSNLDSLLSKSELSAGTVLYRGARMQGERLASLKPGAVLTDKGFVSTSTSRVVATKIVNEGAGVTGPGRGTPVLFRVVTSAGDKGVAVPAHLHSNAEKEVLLPRGSAFKITGVRTVSVEGFKGMLVTATTESGKVLHEVWGGKSTHAVSKFLWVDSDLQVKALKYSPDQPRDDHGRFGSGSSASPGADPTSLVNGRLTGKRVYTPGEIKNPGDWHLHGHYAKATEESGKWQYTYHTPTGNKKVSDKELETKLGEHPGLPHSALKDAMKRNENVTEEAVKPREPANHKPEPIPAHRPGSMYDPKLREGFVGTELRTAAARAIQARPNLIGKERAQLEATKQTTAEMLASVDRTPGLREYLKDHPVSTLVVTDRLIFNGKPVGGLYEGAAQRVSVKVYGAEHGTSLAGAYSPQFSMSDPNFYAVPRLSKDINGFSISTFTHELGHHIDNTSRAVAVHGLYKEIQAGTLKERIVSRYGAANSAEFFAENFAAAIHGGDAYKSNFPKQHAAMKSHLASLGIKVKVAPLLIVPNVKTDVTESLEFFGEDVDWTQLGVAAQEVARLQSIGKLTKDAFDKLLAQATSAVGTSTYFLECILNYAHPDWIDRGDDEA